VTAAPTQLQKEVGARLASFLGRQLSADIEIEMHGRSGEGDANENWLFDAVVRRAEGTERQALVLRRAGPSAAAGSDRGKEFRLLQCLQGSGLPVPLAYWLDEDGRDFGRAAFVMQRCPGRTDPHLMLDSNRFGFDRETRRGLSRRFVELMARIHAVDWRGRGIDRVLGRPDGPPARARLDAIVAEMAVQRLEPWPECAEAIVWLERRMPPPRPELVLTHGEFRTVQGLISESGEITGLIDWEFARISDPADEVAYFLNPTAAPLHLIPGLWEEQDILDCYAELTGIRIGRAELHWWKVLHMLWVMSFVMQHVRGVIEHRIDAIRSNFFNMRLVGLLQALMDQEPV
jgi:aminoglycoside phosphotransferase (APT) family kinase protein